MQNEINAEFLKSLAGTKVRYSAKHFYLWMVAKFGFNKRINYNDLKDYPKTKRTVQRYLADLEDHKMINRHKGNNCMHLTLN